VSLLSVPDRPASLLDGRFGLWTYRVTLLTSAAMRSSRRARVCSLSLSVFSAESGAAACSSASSFSTLAATLAVSSISSSVARVAAASCRVRGWGLVRTSTRVNRGRDPGWSKLERGDVWERSRRREHERFEAEREIELMQ
jgi:hypothetical protein